MVSLTVDGQQVQVPDGAALLDAVRAVGGDLPTLCLDERCSPVGACRLCLVERDGASVAACTTPAGEGDRIRTDDEATVSSARETLELMVSRLPARALDVPGSELAARLSSGSASAVTASARAWGTSSTGRTRT